MVTTMVPEDTTTFFKWRNYAACINLDADDAQNTFFVDKAGYTYRKARAYCANCSVVVDCLIEGMDNELGMWGCTSPNEREDISSFMQAGYNLKKATEMIWKYHREGKLSVPSKSIWEYWNA